MTSDSDREKLMEREVERLARVWFEAVRDMAEPQTRVEWSETTPDAMVAKEIIKIGVRAVLAAAPSPPVVGGDGPILSERAMRVALTGVVPDDGHTIIADMQAEIERLKADYEIQMRKCDAAQIESERLRAALKPFAAMADHYPLEGNRSLRPRKGDPLHGVVTGGLPDAVITVDDLHAAKVVCMYQQYGQPSEEIDK